MNRVHLMAATTVAFAGVAMLFGLAGTATATTSADEPVPGKLLLMLDASGSMKAKDPSGLTKIEAAKKALTGVVGALPDTAQVGLRVYGAKVDGGGKPTPAACADTQLIHPIAALDKTKLTSTITAIKALGETPIAHSLTEALKDLGTEGKRNIILVSDGEESCVPDPCPTVKKLTAAGVDLQIDTVGFGVNAKARKQLQCVADAGKGTYYDAKDADALTTSLSKLSQRALRPFTVSGTPVTGTATAGEAPELTAGQYVDTLTTGAGPRHYSLQRTMPGSTLRIAATMRPAYVADGDNSEVIRLKTTVGSDTCESGQASRLGTSHFEHLATGTIRVAGQLDPRQAQLDECQKATELDLVLDRETGAASPSQVEILVMEEPPASEVDALPAQEEDKPEQASPAPSAPQPVVGGTSFSSAPRIAPGSWSETFVPGETIFYRVPVGWGQRLRLSVLPAPDSVTEDIRLLTHYNPTLYAPDRRVLGEVSLTSGTFGSDEPTQQASHEVRYRNRENPGDEHSDLAGDYFVSIAVPHNRSGNASDVPMTFRVEVEGTVEGAPTYAGTAPDATASPGASPTSSDSGALTTTDAKTAGDNGANWLLWVGLGLVALLGAGGTAYRIVRTRRSAHPGGPPAE